MFSNGPRTVTTGLSLLVDAADPLSYPGSGTSWTDIVTGITGSLSGSITYASDFKGTLVVNNSSSVIIFPTSSGNFGLNSFTVELAFQPNQINGQHWLVAKNSGSFPSWGAFITGSSGSGRITAFFNASSTISCSMSTPVGSIITGSNYLVDINFVPFVGGLNTVYINSEASSSALPNGSGSLSATSSLFISNRNSGSSVGSPLEIFNAKLYTPRLVPGRIRQNYNALSTRLGLPQKSFLFIGNDGLLNLYPGAAAAYSLRLLNNDYVGSAIRVRRSSDNVEQDIGFLGNDLDTTSLLSFVGLGNGFVTTWYDQSGNGQNITQASAVEQPQIVATGSLFTQNNKAAISFNTNGHTLSIPTLSNRSILDQYFVAYTTDTNYLYPDPRSGPYGYVATQNNPSTGINSSYGSPTLYGNGTLLGDLTRGGVYNLLNGYKIVVHQGASTSGWGSYFFNGYSGFEFQGLLQELVAYAFNQSSNRTGIESNINSYYTIY